MTRIRNQWRGVKTSIFCRKICRDKSEIPICWAKPSGKQRIFNEWKIHISSMQKVVMKYCINSSIVWLSVSRCPCSGKRKTSSLFLWAYVWKVCGQLQREKDNFVQITPYSPKITRVESIRYCSQCSGFSPMTSSFLLLASMHIKERTRIPSLREWKGKFYLLSDSALFLLKLQRFLVLQILSIWIAQVMFFTCWMEIEPNVEIDMWNSENQYLDLHQLRTKY